MFAKLEEFIFTKMSESKLPGLSIAITQGEELIFQKGIGFRDVQLGLATTPETLYGIGSVTKSFTALAIMQLVEQGKLKLSDPIDNFVPFKVCPGGETVKISHFLSHSSGIPALAYAEAVIRGVTGAGDKWLPIASVSDLLTFMADAKDWTLNKPGERFYYLNEGYAILGKIIEICSGLNYEEYIKRYILEPLGMNRTFFFREEVERDKNAATPYILTRDGEQKPSSYPFGGISADGALISNVLDLSKYIRMYLNKGKNDGTRILSESSIFLMETPQIGLPYKGSFGDGSYALGLFVTPDFLGYRLINHGGSVLVATAYMGYIPEKSLGIAILANGSGYSLSNIGMYALALALDKEPDELPFIRIEKTLSTLTGTYETYKATMRAQVKRMGNFLTIEIKDKYNDIIVPLVPRDLDGRNKIFYTLNAGIELTVEFMVHDAGIDLVYDRYLLRKTSN